MVKAELANAPDWVDVPSGAGHVRGEGWPGESLRDWHQRHGLLSPNAADHASGSEPQRGCAVFSFAFPLATPAAA